MWQNAPAVVSKRAGHTVDAVVLSQGTAGMAEQHWVVVHPPDPHVRDGLPSCKARGNVAQSVTRPIIALIPVAHAWKPTGQAPKSEHVRAMQHVTLLQLYSGMHCCPGMGLTSGVVQYGSHGTGGMVWQHSASEQSAAPHAMVAALVLICARVNEQSGFVHKVGWHSRRATPMASDTDMPYVQALCMQSRGRMSGRGSRPSGCS